MTAASHSEVISEMWGDMNVAFDALKMTIDCPLMGSVCNNHK